MSAKWTSADIPDQNGRIAIVTGANSGLGLVTARELARAGARVVLACRDEEKGRAAVRAVEVRAPGSELELEALDLASLDSVSSFAGRVRERHPEIDLLINNAGVMATPRRETADGFELQFGTNHLGHFALTGLLLDTLEGREDARVVTLSSGVHRSARIAFDNLGGERHYFRWRAYGQSKLANLMFALELDRRLRAAGPRCLHRPRRLRRGSRPPDPGITRKGRSRRVGGPQPVGGLRGDDRGEGGARRAGVRFPRDVLPRRVLCLLTAPQDAAVVGEPEGDPFGVERLEQRLGVATRGAKLVAESGECDRPLRRDDRSRRGRGVRRAPRDGCASSGQAARRGRRPAARPAPPPRPRRARCRAAGGRRPRAASVPARARSLTGGVARAAGAARRAPVARVARAGASVARPDRERRRRRVCRAGRSSAPRSGRRRGRSADARSAAASDPARDRRCARASRACHGGSARDAGRPRRRARARHRGSMRAAVRRPRSSTTSPRPIASTRTPARFTATRCPAHRPLDGGVVHLGAAHPGAPAGRQQGHAVAGAERARPQRPGDHGAGAVDRERAIDVEHGRAVVRSHIGQTRGDMRDRGADLLDAGAGVDGAVDDRHALVDQRAHLLARPRRSRRGRSSSPPRHPRARRARAARPRARPSAASPRRRRPRRAGTGSRRSLRRPSCARSARGPGRRRATARRPPTSSCAKPRSIDMPRACSSGSRSVSRPVSARTSAVLPWSMCPAVPTVSGASPLTARRAYVGRSGEGVEPSHRGAAAAPRL